VSTELLGDGATDAECREVMGAMGAKDADDCDDSPGVSDEAKSARNRRRSACGVPPPQATAAAASCGDGLTLGVVLRELLKSHWSTSCSSSLGVGPPSSCTASIRAPT